MMQLIPALQPDIIRAIDAVIEENAEQVTALDQAIGDGDHVTNLQRGIDALKKQSTELGQLAWPDAWQKIGMTLMTTVGGASGSLYGTLFLSMSKAAREEELNLSGFSEIFGAGVDAVKKRGKADAGEKTLLDVLIPVAECLRQAVLDAKTVAGVLAAIPAVAETGMESTRDMLATKGRASFLGERTIGHIDAGAKTAQLMICAIVTVLQKYSTSPS